jgi:hypothetical protein
MFVIFSVLSLAFFGLIPLTFFRKNHLVVLFENNKSRIEKLKESVYLTLVTRKPLFNFFQVNLFTVDKVLHYPISLEDVSDKGYLLLFYT